MKFMSLLGIVLVFSASAEIAYVPFDFSMELERYHAIVENTATLEYFGISGREHITYFKNLYEKNFFVEHDVVSTLRIPKIIHQIWIGDRVPEKFKKFQESWQQFHPEWEYRLWTQDDIHRLSLYNLELIQQSRNPGEIADLLRWEILYRFGGVYVDMDFECLSPLDELNYTYDFYIGLQPLDSGLVQLGIGLIGTMPEHPILAHVIIQQKESFNNPLHQHNAPARTGPVFFTKVFVAVAGKNNLRDIALPAHYFYPLDCNADELTYDTWKSKGSFGVHHWAKSWLLPEFRKKEFQDLGN